MRELKITASNKNCETSLIRNEFQDVNIAVKIDKVGRPRVVCRDVYPERARVTRKTKTKT